MNKITKTALTMIFLAFIAGGIIILAPIFLKMFKGDSERNSLDQPINQPENKQPEPLSIGKENDYFSGNLWKVQAGIPVLCYHQIISNEEYKKHPTPFAVTIDQFKEQIKFLADKGYQSISMADYFDYIKGKKSLGENSVLITFDDGLNDFIYQAEVVLKKYNFTGVLFVYPTYIMAKKSRALSLSQLKKVKELGHDIESHTFWHPLLHKMTAREQRDQFQRSRNYLEKHIAAKVNHLAFPFGMYDSNSLRELEQLNYLSAFTVFPGRNLPYSDPYLQNRYMIVRSDNLKTFANNLAKRSLPVRQINPPQGSHFKEPNVEVSFLVPQGLDKEKLKINYAGKKVIYDYNSQNGQVQLKLNLRKLKINKLDIIYSEEGRSYLGHILYHYNTQAKGQD